MVLSYADDDDDEIDLSRLSDEEIERIVAAFEPPPETCAAPYASEAFVACRPSSRDAYGARPKDA
jgi:hypothetical protein